MKTKDQPNNVLSLSISHLAVVLISLHSRHVCLVARIPKCENLTLTNGSCNPYAVVALSRGDRHSKRDDFKRTVVKKKSINPSFDETFLFDVSVMVKPSVYGSCLYKLT